MNGNPRGQVDCGVAISFYVYAQQDHCLGHFGPHRTAEHFLIRQKFVSNNNKQQIERINYD
jgi:hypothetical protein